MFPGTVKLFSSDGLRWGNFKEDYNYKFITLKLVAHKMSQYIYKNRNKLI